jgi:hypothetical protein
MLPNAFIGKLEKPRESDLVSVLASAKPLWDGLIAETAEEHEVVDQEWKSYSPKYGWSLRLKRKNRNILYLGPSHGGFVVSFILGDKAVKAARKSRLPARILKIFDEATRYPEGTAIRMEVKKPGDIEIVKKLVVMKLQN